MKTIARMTGEEIAALVCQTLSAHGVTVTLTGGGCVAIWSEGAYVSRDLDFIEEGPVPRRLIANALSSLGFNDKNRYFVHPETTFYIEFPAGPLTVGDQRIRDVAIRESSTGRLRLLSATDCVKDRLAAWYFWKDGEALSQAILVARKQDVDLVEIKRWSAAEGQGAYLASFLEAING